MFLSLNPWMWSNGTQHLKKNLNFDIAQVKGKYFRKGMESIYMYLPVLPITLHDDHNTPLHNLYGQMFICTSFVPSNKVVFICALWSNEINIFSSLPLSKVIYSKIEKEINEQKISPIWSHVKSHLHGCKDYMYWSFSHSPYQGRSMPEYQKLHNGFVIISTLKLKILT